MRMQHNSKAAAGFSLVEVTVALGLMAFCLLALFGLLPVGLTSNQISVEQTTAANIASQIAADLNATPLTETKSTRFGFDMTGTTGSTQTLFFSEGGDTSQNVGGSASTGGATTPASRYRATIAFYPGPKSEKLSTKVRVLVSWPAAADPSASGWPKNAVGTVDAVTALNRNP